MPRKKSKTEWILYAIIGLVGIAYYYSSIMRAEKGWFSDGQWIFINTLFYVIFFGLLSGVIIARAIKMVKKR